LQLKDWTLYGEPVQRGLDEGNSVFGREGCQPVTFQKCVLSVVLHVYQWEQWWIASICFKCTGSVG